MTLSEMIAECVRLAPDDSEDFHLEHMKCTQWAASCCYMYNPEDEKNQWTQWCLGDSPEEAVEKLLQLSRSNIAA